MPKRPVDVDVKQSFRDIFFSRNEYRLDDRFVLRDGERHPFALLCPGGGYAMVCSFIEGVPIAKKLNEKGISVFILYYRVKNKAKYPAPQDDAARAVREIMSRKDEYRIIPEGYSIWGASAGGHLAASFGTTAMGYRKYGLPAPAALVLAYPVISMKAALTHQGTHDNLIGKNAPEESVHAASVEEHVDPEYPPTFIWCGDADDLVPPENTKQMDEALSRAGVAHECIIYPDVTHGVGPATGTNAEGWIDKAVDFWNRQKEG